MKLVSSNRCFSGKQQRYTHYSSVLSCQMHFSIFLPPQLELLSEEKNLKVPLITYLAGLTGTDESFAQKGGAQQRAAELGIVLVSPDTSPRGEDVPDDPEQAYDFGLGAGFYLNATQAPWDKHYRMYDYISQELRQLIVENFPVDDNRHGIMGHSMGGHGALTIALKNTDRYTSVSAFAPIVSPLNCPWGNKAFTLYLGEDRSLWENYDSVALIEKAAKPLPMMIDQGTDDQFLESELKPELLVEAANRAGYPLQMNTRPNYDHSYYFISTVMDEHLAFHAQHFEALD